MPLKYRRFLHLMDILRKYMGRPKNLCITNLDNVSFYLGTVQKMPVINKAASYLVRTQPKTASFSLSTFLFSKETFLRKLEAVISSTVLNLVCISIGVRVLSYPIPALILLLYCLYCTAACPRPTTNKCTEREPMSRIVELRGLRSF